MAFGEITFVKLAHPRQFAVIQVEFVSQPVKIVCRIGQVPRANLLRNKIRAGENCDSGGKALAQDQVKGAQKLMKVQTVEDLKTIEAGARAKRSAKNNLRDLPTSGVL